MPETILAASKWTASRSFFDAYEQLYHTVSLYSICKIHFQGFHRHSELNSFKKVYPSPGFFWDANNMFVPTASFWESKPKMSVRRGLIYYNFIHIYRSGVENWVSFSRNHYRQCFNWIGGYQPTVSPYGNGIEIPVKKLSCLKWVSSASVVCK